MDLTGNELVFVIPVTLAGAPAAQEEIVTTQDIANLGGGGGGGGISRSIHTVSSDTVMASASNTDYVYYANGTITLTFPTAVGTKNEYTVKNIGTGIVTMLAVGGQIINDVQSDEIVIANQYDAMTFGSDNSNWNLL